MASNLSSQNSVEDQEVQVRETVFICFATKVVKFAISKLGSSIEYFVYYPLIRNLPSHKHIHFTFFQIACTSAAI